MSCLQAAVLNWAAKANRCTHNQTRCIIICHFHQSHTRTKIGTYGNNDIHFRSCCVILPLNSRSPTGPPARFPFGEKTRTSTDRPYLASLPSNKSRNQSLQSIALSCRTPISPYRAVNTAIGSSRPPASLLRRCNRRLGPRRGEVRIVVRDGEWLCG